VLAALALTAYERVFEEGDSATGRVPRQSHLRIRRFRT
jgi:hypothetical protein